MIFATVPLAQAAGLVLAHGLTLPDGKLSKGTILTPAHLKRLADARINSVTGARLEPGDVDEDTAATRAAAALCGPGVQAEAANTGRCNLVAAHDGVLVLDEAALHAANAVDEALTVGTLAPFSRVVRGQMLATIKVIPYAVPCDLLEQWEATSGTHSAIRVAGFASRAVTLIQTRLPGTADKVLRATEAVTRDRVESLGSTLTLAPEVTHDTTALAAAIEDTLHQAEPHAGIVLIAGASATTDRRDVIPAAIDAAGGQVIHLGMPVDPGNLLVLGESAEGVPVLGLPGCARSPKRNGVDWVLERLLAGLTVDRAAIMGMGVGGLLHESAVRGRARQKTAPALAVAVLAAGKGSRMGGGIKVLEDLGGKPMLGHVLDAVHTAALGLSTVITGTHHDAIAAALAGTATRLLRNPAPEQGLSGSLSLAAQKAPDDAAGLMVLLGDMPLIQPETLRLLADTARAHPEAIVAPSFGATRGHPVIWPRDLWPALSRLHGDRGGQTLLQDHADRLHTVPVKDEGVLLDADTPDALNRLRARL